MLQYHSDLPRGIRWCSTGAVQLIRNQQVVSSNLTTSSRRNRDLLGSFFALWVIFRTHGPRLQIMNRSREIAIRFLISPAANVSSGRASNLTTSSKKRNRVLGFFFLLLHSSLFTFHSSLAEPVGSKIRKYRPRAKNRKRAASAFARGGLRFYLLAFSRSFLRISTRRILPLMVLGSSLTNSTILGYL